MTPRKYYYRSRFRPELRTGPPGELAYHDTLDTLAGRARDTH